MSPILNPHVLGSVAYNGTRKFDFQNPLKEKLTREINKRCEEKLKHKFQKVKKTRNKQVKKQNKENMTQFDYYTSTWDRLIARTQTTDQELKRGEFTRSKERDRQDSNTRRTLDPNFVERSRTSFLGPTASEYYRQPPQTAKHTTSKQLAFKPPLVPRDLDITGCGK